MRASNDILFFDCGSRSVTHFLNDNYGGGGLQNSMHIEVADKELVVLTAGAGRHILREARMRV